MRIAWSRKRGSWSSKTSATVFLPASPRTAELPQRRGERVVFLLSRRRFQHGQRGGVVKARPFLHRHVTHGQIRRRQRRRQSFLTFEIHFGELGLFPFGASR